MEPSFQMDFTSSARDFQFCDSSDLLGIGAFYGIKSYLFAFWFCYNFWTRTKNLEIVSVVSTVCDLIADQIQM